MALWSRCSLLLVVLLYGFGLSSALVRPRRQSDPWWRSQQRGYPESQADPWSRVQPVSGFGAPRALRPLPEWGSRYPSSNYWSRQLLPPTPPPSPLIPSPSSPIRVQCGEASMVVTVTRDFYGNGRLVNPSDLTLGSCPPGPQPTSTAVIFDYDLQDCGNGLMMTPDWLIYNTTLRYSPTSPSNVPIIRSNPAVVPIQCFYPRNGNVSSGAIQPTWLPFSTTVTSEERLDFGLRLMTADWSAPVSSPVFRLGDMLYIEASLNTQNHVPMILFIDSCVATITPDVTSTPSYNLISNYGCLTDGLQPDSSSTFVSPRPAADQLLFMVDAFRFTGSAASLIYITCSLRAAPINQTPDPMNKACSYSKTTSSWSPVEGPSAICQCCATGNCVVTAGQRRPWEPSQGRQRGSSRSFGKRDVGSEKSGQATLGPIIIVTGEEPNKLSGAAITQASRSAGQDPPQLWVLVAIGSVTSVVVAVALTLAGKCLLKRFSHKESV